MLLLLNQKLKKDWIAALRGKKKDHRGKKYEQGRGSLCQVGHSGNRYWKRHCCLGVLEEIRTGTPLGRIKGDGLFLPEYVFDKKIQIKLANMNDGNKAVKRHTFEEIADFIENNPYI